MERIIKEPFDLKEIKQIVKLFRSIIFPSYFETIIGDKELFLADKKHELEELLASNIHKVFLLTGDQMENDFIARRIVSMTKNIKTLLESDLEATRRGDPACYNDDEIILCYPGFYATLVYRLANAIAKIGIPILPRLLSEYVHSQTGIDIHPNAQIGKSFFIDHGTGVVIGETSIIGEDVRIYHGVTLGALSLREGSKLKGNKRHPTIGNHVTIYSGASIFGGETVIGDNVTISANSIITASVSSNHLVIHKSSKTIKLKK